MCQSGSKGCGRACGVHVRQVRKRAEASWIGKECVGTAHICVKHVEVEYVSETLSMHYRCSFGGPDVPETCGRRLTAHYAARETFGPDLRGLSMDHSTMLCAIRSA